MDLGGRGRGRGGVAAAAATADGELDSQMDRAIKAAGRDFGGVVGRCLCCDRLRRLHFKRLTAAVEHRNDG